MRTIVSKVLSGAKESYVRSKLTKAIQRYGKSRPKPSDEDLNNWVDKVVRQIGTEVPTATPGDFYTLTADQSAEIEARKRCALATLLRASPLLDEEKIKEDFFSFLKKPFGGLPVNTAVLRRTTNKAMIFYLFDDFQVVNGDMKYIEPAAVPYTRFVAKRAVAVAPIVITVALNLAKALVGLIANQVGGAIIAEIFPPSTPDYFDEVYINIREIVHDELIKADIDKINGIINGVAAWTRNTYIPRKNANPPRAELLGMLDDQVERLYETIGILMLDDYAKPGFPVFMVAAGLQLVLMQEQALVDPNQPDPYKSSFAKTVKLNAQEYLDHAESTYDDIIQARKDAVIINWAYQDFTEPSPDFKYRWEDTITGEKSQYYLDYYDDDKVFHSGKTAARADREQYLPGVVDQLTQELGDPVITIFPLWRELTERPIPPFTPLVPPPPTFIPDFVLKRTYEIVDGLNEVAVRYEFAITNWFMFPPEMFEPAPDLPKVANKIPSRTMVHVYRAENDRVWGGNACLRSPKELLSMEHSRNKKLTSPIRTAYAVVEDRKTKVKYTSKVIDLE